MLWLKLDISAHTVECLSSHVLELQSVLIDILLTSLTSQTRSTTTENMKKAKEAALS
jgi:hypothetical protein